MAGGLALAAPIASIAGGLFGSSNAQNVQLPPQFNMPNMTAAAGNAYSDIGSLPATQYGQQFLPQYEQATQNLYNNPYASTYQQGSAQAGQLGQAAGLNTIGAGQTVQGAGQSILPYAQTIMNTAFDPQQALYNQTLQQLQDQTRASEAARGIATSPYGAGVENSNLQQFNINWDNNQLARQTQGLSAVDQAVNQAGQSIGQGAGLQTAGAQGYGAASALPYQAGQQIGTGQQQAISSLLQGGSQAQGLAQTPVQDYLAYLGVGNQAGGVANQQAQVGLNQANLAFNQNQTLGQNLGAGLQGLGSQSNMNWLNSAFS